MKGFIVGLICVVFVAGIVGLMYVTYNNAEVKTRNLVAAQERVIAANFDKMWKVIKQTAQVPEKAVESFKEMYEPLIAGRYEGEKGQMFMKWISEQNPAFDYSLFAKLQTAIEANRQDFFYEQEKLISMKKQHDDLRTTIPAKWFVGGRDEIIIKVITSEVTDEVMRTGQENNIDLFK